MCCPKTLNVKLLTLDFQQDHRLLKDGWVKGGQMDWRNVGAPYTPHDWAPSREENPVSYSMVKTLAADRSDPVEASTRRGYAKADPANRVKMQVQLRLQITPECGCTEKCQIYGTGKEYLRERKILFQSGWIMLSPSSDRSVTLEQAYYVPTGISGIDLEIDWYIKSHPSEAQPSFPSMTVLDTTVNKRYLTFGKPVLSGSRESGVTLRRMDRSVEWVGEKYTNDHPTIITHLFKKYKAYSLAEYVPSNGSYTLTYSNLSNTQRTKLVDPFHPERMKHLGDNDWPAFFHNDVGAWPAADPELVEFGAECQAICRLSIGMLQQLGSTAELSVVYATADFSKPNEAIIDGHTNDRPSGPDSTKHYVLVDAAVKKGDKYVAPVMDPRDSTLKTPPGYEDNNTIGWNNFEAYLRYKFKENGSEKSRWWGGGVGEHEGNLIHVFWGLAEYQFESATIFGQTVTYRKITGVYEYE